MFVKELNVPGELVDEDFSSCFFSFPFEWADEPNVPNVIEIMVSKTTVIVKTGNPNFLRQLTKYIN